MLVCAPPPHAWLLYHGGGFESTEGGRETWFASRRSWLLPLRRGGPEPDPEDPPPAWFALNTSVAAEQRDAVERVLDSEEQRARMLPDGRLIVVAQQSVVELWPPLTGDADAVLARSYVWRARLLRFVDEYEDQSVTPLNETHAIVFGGTGDFDAASGGAAPTFLLHVPRDASGAREAEWTRFDLASAAADSNGAALPMALPPLGGAPLPLAGHSAALLGTPPQLVTFGGAVELSDELELEGTAIMQRLDIERRQWFVMPIVGRTRASSSSGSGSGSAIDAWPPAMHDAAFASAKCSDGSERLVLFGGSVPPTWMGVEFDDEAYDGTWLWDASACEGDCGGGAAAVDRCVLGACVCDAPFVSAFGELDADSRNDQFQRVELLNAASSGLSVAPDCSASGLPGWIVAVVAVAALCLLAAIVAAACLVVQRRRQAQSADDAVDVDGTGDNDGDADDAFGTEALRVASQFKIDDVDVERGEVLGEGAFGTVRRGRLHGRTPVAIKELKQGADIDQRELLAEAKTWQALPPHPNLAQFFGVVLKPFALVFELVPLGSLEDALYGADASRHVDFAAAERCSLELDVACGLAHLHAFQIVHRDCAARNVLLEKRADSGEYRGKLTDFGQARTANGTYLEGSTVSKVGPVRWMAPEQMADMTFSAKSDVYALAVVWYEIEARQQPWAGLSNLVAAQQVLGGKHLTLPDGANEHIRAMALKCWSKKPQSRPSARRVVRTLVAAVGDADDSARLPVGRGDQSASATTSLRNSAYSRMPEAPSGRVDNDGNDGAGGDAYSRMPSEPAIYSSSSGTATSSLSGKLSAVDRHFRDYADCEELAATAKERNERPGKGAPAYDVVAPLEDEQNGAAAETSESDYDDDDDTEENSDAPRQRKAKA